METVTRKDGEKTSGKVAMEKPQEKVSDKLVIEGNNSTVRTVTPPFMLNKDSTGISSARHMIEQGVATVEIGVIWKPRIVDGQGYHILGSYSGSKYPTIAASISSAYVLPVDTAEMMKLNDDRLT